MRLLDLSITKKILIFITLPVLVEMSFFAVLLQNFNDLQRDLEEESRAVDALVEVNLILTGTMSAGGSMLMFRAMRNNSYMVQAHQVFARVDVHVKKLKELAARDNNPAIQGFVKVIDDADEMFGKTYSAAYEDEYLMEGLKMSGTVKSFLKRIEIAGSKVIEEQNAKRSKVREEGSHKRETIEKSLEAMTLANILLALVLASTFSLTMGRRLRTIIDNTVRIPAGKPLNPEISGTDELAKLDHLVHSMDAELAVIRKKERAMIDNTAEIICSLDRSFRVTEVNSAVEKRLGYEQAEFLGSLFQSHVEQGEREQAFDALQRCLGSGDEQSFEVRMIGADKKIRDIEVTARWSEFDQSVFCIMRDITLRKEAERLKQEVIAMISHDLRAPLTSIGMTLEMFCDGILGEINERGEKLAAVAKRSVTSLIMMINDLLDLERLEATGIQLSYSSVAIKSLVSDAIDTVLPEAAAKSISIEKVYDDGAVTLDDDRMRRVVVNLLNNAIKFSPPSSSIMVKAVRRSQSLHVEIIDEGPGIPEDQIEFVFDKFRQVGTGSEGEKKGSGLGLAICKSFVEAHGGKIAVESQVGEGTTFWFDVPLEAAVKA